MKRLRAVAVILLLIFAITIYGSCLVNDVTNHMIETLNTIEAYANQGLYTTAENEMNNLKEYYGKYEHKLAVFLRRDYTCATTINLSTITNYLNSDHTEDLQAEINRSRAQINMVKHLFFSLF